MSMPAFFDLELEVQLLRLWIWSAQHKEYYTLHDRYNYPASAGQMRTVRIMALATESDLSVVVCEHQHYLVWSRGFEFRDRGGVNAWPVHDLETASMMIAMGWAP